MTRKGAVEDERSRRPPGLSLFPVVTAILGAALALQVAIFLMADAVTCALPNQNTAQGAYNIERMVQAVLK